MRRWIGEQRELADWRRRRFAAPSPAFVKREVLLRNGIAGATWVETGTYRGDTTAVLARQAKRVISLEPAAELYRAALGRFAATPTVELINATSEGAFPGLLPTLEGEVCFWLDGHFSGGPTFQGPNDTPIAFELEAIGAQLPRWPRAVVMVDDLRLFTGQVYVYGPYPPLADLVDWARRHRLAWHIEHDILVASKA